MAAIVRDCDLCKEQGRITPATVDAKLRQGPWAYLCDAHLASHGTTNAQLITVLATVGQKAKQKYMGVTS